MNLADYEIIDRIEKITIADSFIKGSNKIGDGHGEAKLYIGQIGNEKVEQFWDMQSGRGKAYECFILKSDLQKYLDEVKVEYEYPTQNYAKIGLDIWCERQLKISVLDNILTFKLYDQNGLQPPRIYFNTHKKDDNYNLIREVALSNISYLACLKLEHKLTRKTIYYFRIFADLSRLSLEAKEQELIQKIEQNPNIKNEQKERICTARIGQGKYREGLLSECPFCPVTMVSDDRLLIASHIKPWRMSEDFEKIDPKNGFMLTPTIDFLFDKGYISFTDEKQMILSPWISKITYKNLGLSEGKIYPLLPVLGREKYLDFHRKNIFKK